jgi:hypothetical protein
MFVAKRLWAVVLGVLLAAFVFGTAFADQLPEPAPTFFGHATVDFSRGTVTWDHVIPQINVNLDVYSNVTSAANFGFSSTDLASQWGDRLTTTGTGTLDQSEFTIFNSGTSAGPLTTVTATVSFFDAVTSTAFGGYSTNINFGAGLAPGFFSIITVTGLSPLVINLTTTDIVVIQQASNVAGGASRLGIASMDPPTIGSSIAQMYINSSTVGPPGFYTITGQNANPGYLVNVIPPPVPTKPTSWGRIKGLYR